MSSSIWNDAMASRRAVLQGIVAVAVWTVLSCLVHLVRLFQAWARQRKGETVRSWLADA